MKYIDIICDLETLGTKTDATIIQIAAVACEIDTRRVLDTFNIYIKPDTSKTSIDIDTINWWVKTNPTLFNEMLSKKDAVTEKDAIKSFTEWLERVRFTYAQREQDKKCELHFWGNGILFDNCLIRACCERNGYDYPIKYYNDRDLRTLLMMASMKSGRSEHTLREQAKEKGEVYHDALTDCMYELRLAFNCYEIIRGF